MAWMNQERKAKIVENVKPILKKYGMKGTFSVRNHSTITLTLTSGSVDFVSDMNPTSHGQVIDKVRLMQDYHFDVNPYWFQEHYNGEAYHFLNELIPAMKSGGWYDNSDAQIDYFDTAYYFNIQVGKWKAPYTVTK